MSRPEDQNCTICRRISAGGDPPSEVVWEFAHSVVILGPWQFFEGYCIVLSRYHVRELFDLDTVVRHAFVDEVATLGKALATVFEPRKLNVEMLGNQVPHLHCHMFLRYQHDPDHLKPAWVAIDRAEMDPAERHRLEAPAVNRADLRERIRAELTRATKS
jgi:diadenosine tetraphosphate (Ap4A) HIT family hydrolase